MTTATHQQPAESHSVAATMTTMHDLLDQLGGIAPDRVLLSPPPGTATEADLLQLPDEVQKICELIDGTLVVKAVGAPESEMAVNLVGLIAIFLKQSGQKTVRILGPDGHTRYFGGNVRMPDIAVFLRSRLPGGKIPKDQRICPVPPIWVVEILSPRNTRGEIDKKLRTFFDSGVQLAWVVDPRRRTVRVHRSADEFAEVGEDGRLDAGDILPGFTLSVREWFEEAE